MLHNRLKINNLQGDEPEFIRPANARCTFKAEGDTGTLEIYDIVSRWGASHRMVRDALKGSKANTITVKINSPGGDVFEGLAIYNELKAHSAKIRIEVVALAASIASVIAMAGDEILIADNAFIMIHNSWTVAVGDSKEMADAANVLSKIDKGFQRTYAGRTGQSVNDIRDMMDKETWLDAGDAIEKGFADALLTSKVEASAAVDFDLSGFSNTPDILAHRPKAKSQIAAVKKVSFLPESNALMQSLESLKGMLRSA